MSTFDRAGLGHILGRGFQFLLINYLRVSVKINIYYLHNDGTSKKYICTTFSLIVVFIKFSSSLIVVVIHSRRD